MPLSIVVAVAVSLALGMDYTGLWYKDDDRSDDPQAKIEETVQGLIKKASKGRSSASDLDPAVLSRMRGVIDGFVQYSDELEIEHDARELVVDDGSERLRIFYLDDERHERQMPDGTRLETTTTAVGAQIDVYMKTEHGAKIYEEYRLSNDGSTMSLTVRLEDKQLEAPLVIRSIYTRAP